MSELAQLAAKLFNYKDEFKPKIVSTEKRVRGQLAGEFIFDTVQAKLVWENPYYPFYWIPEKDFLPAASFTADKPVSGIQSSTSKLQVKDRSVSTLLVPTSFNSELAGYVKIKHEDLDAWYEELSEVFSHPKDPFHRVDILPSGRHIRVELDGTVLADTAGEGGVMSLWETNFPGRWYLPRTAVRWEYLKPSDTKTSCPYKGTASYYHAVIDGKTHQDVVWWYENPTAESAAVRGLLCFYPDKVNTTVDGSAIEKIGMPKVKEDKTEHGDNCNC